MKIIGFVLNNGYIYETINGSIRIKIEEPIEVDTYLLRSDKVKLMRINGKYGTEQGYNQELKDISPTKLKLIHRTVYTEHPPGYNPLSPKCPMWNVFVVSEHTLKFKSNKQRESFKQLINKLH